MCQWIDASERLPEVGQQIQYQRLMNGGERLYTARVVERHITDDKSAYVNVRTPRGTHHPLGLRLTRNKWRPYPCVCPDSSRDSLDVIIKEGSTMFHPTSVKTKGGHRAQVVKDPDKSVVWESTEIFTDHVIDDNHDVVSGATKAQDKAREVINTVLTSLFDKVK